MKNTTLLILTLTLLFACKKKEINPDDYPTTIEREVQFELLETGQKYSNLVFTESTDGILFQFDIVTFDNLELTIDPFDTIQGFIVENSVWENGDDIIEFTKNKNGINDYTINNNDLSFEQLTTGNYHIEIRHINGELLAEGNCGINSILDTINYKIPYDLYDVDARVGFRTIGNGSVLSFYLVGNNTIYYANHTNVQLVASDKNNPLNILEDEILRNNFNNKNYDHYQWNLIGYSTSEIKELDAHINIIDKGDNSVIAKINIGINAP